MKVLVFGASGATGRQVVAQGLERGFFITAFVRNPSKLTVTHPRLTVTQGDVGDAGAVSNAVKGHDAVVSTLGVGTPLRHDPVVIDGVRFIVRSMTEWNVKRIVYMSFIGVSDSRADAGFIVRFVARWPLRNEIRDHEIKEGLVTGSALDWTIVRPPTLTNGPKTGTYRAGSDIAARSVLPTLSRADVADGILRELGEGAHPRTVVRLQPE
jgi:putative NADH-flavin reductase